MDANIPQKYEGRKHNFIRDWARVSVQGLPRCWKDPDLETRFRLMEVYRRRHTDDKHVNLPVDRQSAGTDLQQDHQCRYATTPVLTGKAVTLSGGWSGSDLRYHEPCSAFLVVRAVGNPGILQSRTVCIVLSDTPSNLWRFPWRAGRLFDT